MNRTDTNLLIKDLCQHQEENPDYSCSVTIVAGGQLITGNVISEDKFFSIGNNISLKEYFIKNIRNPRLEKLNSGEKVDFRDELKEYFLYLEDAHYVQNGILVPKDAGLTIQVRVSDITAFTFLGLTSE